MKTLLALILVCCSFGGASAYAATAALLLEHDQPSPWVEQLKSGFMNAAKNGNMAADIIVAPKHADQTAIFREAAASHDLVIVASDALHEILRDNAANFRRVMFGSIDAGIRAPNIMSVTFADEQASFLAGAAAAMFAKDQGTADPIIGWLSGMDVPAMRSLFNGYSEGAHFAEPGCRVIQAVTGSFTDSAAAAAKAAWLLDSGARIIALASGAGNAAAREVIEKAGGMVIELDSSDRQPSMGVIKKSADRAVAEIVNAAAADKFAGKEIIVYNLANGGADFIGFEQFAKKHNAATRALRRIGELRHELITGSIRVPSLRQRTLCDCLD